MNIDKTRLEPLFREAFEKAVEIRRDLHMHPELSSKEVRTSARIKEILESFGIENRSELGNHGLIGTVYGKDRQHAIGIRADFDALPVTEEADVPWKSLEPGRMHACGHDMHTAALLGTALVLKKYSDMGGELPMSVRFLFEPEEETTGGARAMIANGAMADPEVTKVFAYHVNPHFEYGKFHFTRGVTNATEVDFKITIKGRSCHGAHPEMGIDPIPAGCALVTSLQTVVSRRLAPTNTGLITIGAFNAGTISNVIPETCTLLGTIRALDMDTRDLMINAVDRMVRNTASAYGCTGVFDYQPTDPVLINDDSVLDTIRSVASELVGESNVDVSYGADMSSDDFAVFSSMVPGCYFNIGSTIPGSPEVYDIHHPKFQPDERVLDMAIRTEVLSALKLME